jgi:hypothetical protein
MRLSLTGLIRLGVFLGLGACLFAIWLGRQDTGGVRFRMSTAPQYSVINGFTLNEWPSDPRFLDVTSGAVKPFTPPGGDRLDFASCSPWLDDQGEYQIVGRWSRRMDGSESTEPECGLARYSLPSGRVLNKIALDSVPESHPCWLPGNSTHLIYAAGDGLLYQIEFEDDPDGESEGNDPRPRRIVWECPQPGPNLMIRDPVLSLDPRMKNRLIVSMSYRGKVGDNRLIPTRLWWLELSSDGSSVVSAGPLAPAKSASGVQDESRLGSEERCPNLAVTPDHELILVYLWQPVNGSRWQLRLAPVTFDKRSGNPVANTRESRILANDHLGELAPFSIDGRFVYAIVQGATGRPKLERLATASPAS